APEELHAEELAQVGRVLRLVAQDEVLQAEEPLIGGVVIDVDLEARLGAAAASVAARPDGNVANGLIAPPEISRIAGALLEMLFQRLPVARAHRQTDFVDDGIIEERGGRVVLGSSGRDGDEALHRRSRDQTGHAPQAVRTHSSGPYTLKEY